MEGGECAGLPEGASLEGSCIEEVLQVQFELLTRALAVHDMLVARVQDLRGGVVPGSSACSSQSCMRLTVPEDVQLADGLSRSEPGQDGCTRLSSRDRFQALEERQPSLSAQQQRDELHSEESACCRPAASNARRQLPSATYRLLPQVPQAPVPSRSRQPPTRAAHPASPTSPRQCSPRQTLVPAGSPRSSPVPVGYRRLPPVPMSTSRPPLASRQPNSARPRMQSAPSLTVNDAPVRVLESDGASTTPKQDVMTLEQEMENTRNMTSPLSERRPKWTRRDAFIKSDAFTKTDLVQPLLVEPGQFGGHLEVPWGKVPSDPSSGTHTPALPKPQHSLFPSTGEPLKARVLAALHRPEYKVEELYKESGFCASVASSNWFQEFILIIIGLNTIWIAVETDQNHAAVLIEAPMIFQVTDNAFCSIFTFEIMVRFLAFKNKMDPLRDGWFVFDAILVFFMIWETWICVALYVLLNSTTGAGSTGHTSIIRVLRIFRLTRIARMGRLLRSMPELMVLVRGMYEGVRSVSATLILLILIIYIFAVFFTQLLAGNEVADGCFDSVPEAMNCLLLQGVFPDQATLLQQVQGVGLRYYVFLLIYLTFVSLTVMNMLIAVLCEVVSVVAQVDKDENSMRELKKNIGDVLQSLGVPEGSQEVSKEHFSHLADNPGAMRSLHEFGVDVVALVELADFLFCESDSLALTQFVEVVLQFRGSNTATVKDIVDMRSFLRRELSDLEQRIAVKRGSFRRQHEERVNHTAALQGS